MARLTYDDLTRDPQLLERLLRQARCERAEAVYHLLVLPVKRLFGARPQARGRAACAGEAY